MEQLIDVNLLIGEALIKLRKAGWHEGRCEIHNEEEYRFALKFTWIDAAASLVRQLGGLKIETKVLFVSSAAIAGLSLRDKVIAAIGNCCPVAASTFLSEICYVFVDSKSWVYVADEQGGRVNEGLGGRAQQEGVRPGVP